MTTMAAAQASLPISSKKKNSQSDNRNNTLSPPIVLSEVDNRVLFTHLVLHQYIQKYVKPRKAKADADAETYKKAMNAQLPPLALPKETLFETLTKEESQKQEAIYWQRANAQPSPPKMFSDVKTTVIM